MIQPNMFTSGTNSVQYYHFFNNEVTQELVQIIRNKKENHWFGMYSDRHKDRFFVIPVEVDANEQTMLQRVCDWYNNGKPEREYREAPEVNPPRISPTLLEIQNMFGDFPLNAAKRVQAFLDEPTVERWDDISGIIIDGWKTVWQLLEEHGNGPRITGPVTDITGRIVEDWSRVPDPLEVLRAIKCGIQNKKMC